MEVSIRNFLLLAILTLACSQSCQPNSWLDGLESGSRSINLAVLQVNQGTEAASLKIGSTSNAYSVTFSRKHLELPQVAVALTGFEAIPNSGLAVSISCLEASASGASLSIATPWNITNWKSLRFVMLGSSRPEIEISTIKLAGIKPDSTVSIPLRGRLANPAFLSARVFVSGFMVAPVNSTLSLWLSNQQLNSTHLSVSTHTLCTVDALQLSYILYDHSQPAYAHSFSLDSPSPLEYVTLRQRAVSSLGSYLYGIVGFQTTTNEAIRLSGLIDDSFLVEVKSTAFRRVAMSLVAIGRAPATVCERCVGKLPFYNEACQEQCASDQARVTYSDGSQGCGVCHSLTNFELSQGQCQCKPGFVLRNDSCVRMAADSHIATQVTVDGLKDEVVPTLDSQQSQQMRSASLGIIQVRRSSAARIPLKPIFGEGSSQLARLWPTSTASTSAYPSPVAQNTPLNGLVQSAATKLPVVSSSALAPPATPAAASCFDSNSYWMGSQCACQPSYYNISGRCQMCPASTYWLGDTCATYPAFSQNTINQGIAVSANSLFADGQPIQSSQPNGSNQAPYYTPIPAIPGAIAGAALPNQYSPIICPPDRVLQDQRCVCLPGTVESPTGPCTPNLQEEDEEEEETDYIYPQQNTSPPVFYAAPVASANIPPSASPSQLSPNAPLVQQSQPTPTYASLPSIPAVNPPSSAVGVPNSAAIQPSAPPPSVPSQQPTSPTVINPQTPPSSAIPVPELSRKPAYSPDTNTVTTDDSFQDMFDDDFFRSKQTKPRENKRKKDCGPNGEWRPLKGCRCFKGFYPHKDRCNPCPTNSTSSKGTCICSKGLFFNKTSGQCRSCPPSTFPINGNCISCPQNSTFDPTAKRCVCESGFRMQRDVCVPNRQKSDADGVLQCPNGLLINSVCIPCAQNSHPEGGVCQCDSGYERPAPSDTCRKKPSQCPKHSSADTSGNCTCQPGYYNDSGICAECADPHSTCSSWSNCTGCQPGYSMINGRCNSACPPSQYLSNSTCHNCTAYCGVCQGPNDCAKCASFFTWNSSCNKCQEICGDGRRFILACDDGNTFDGDGCSSKCTIESGYLCFGGGPYSPDTCIRPEKAKEPSKLGPLVMTLKLSPRTSIGISVFLLSILPEVTAYSEEVKGEPAVLAARSKQMIRMTFEGSQTNKLTGSCSQQPTQLDSWTCTVNFNNQPPSTQFAALLTATAPDGRTASLSVPIQPPKRP